MPSDGQFESEIVTFARVVVSLVKLVVTDKKQAELGAGPPSMFRKLTPCRDNEPARRRPDTTPNVSTVGQEGGYQRECSQRRLCW